MVRRLRVLILVWIGVQVIHAQPKMDYPYQPIPFNKVHVDDPFWSPRLDINQQITIPFCFNQCKETGRVSNFSRAAGLEEGEFCTQYAFDDTDIYKTIEAASYSLTTLPNSALSLYVDSLINLVGLAQESDGYLYTARTINPKGGTQYTRMGPERWVKEREHSHELYNAGHLYEAAAAHFTATGKRNLLDIAIRNAELVLREFGPGKRAVAPGHQVIEMGLVKLYRVTGDTRFLQLAKFFVDQRGRGVKYAQKGTTYETGTYWQDHVPVTEQTEAVGHAVRAGYLYAAMADIAALTGDAAYTAAIDRIWDNMVQKKYYLTGGVGAVGNGERFGDNYELPNRTAYNETCAAIGQLFWNHRMFLLHGDAKYIDVLERTLYNGFLSGLSLDGRSFFYSNTLEVNNHFTHPDLEKSRKGWFVCACCPPNIARFIPSLPGYIYARRDERIYVNLYISNQTSIELKRNEYVVLQQYSQYPWEGNVELRVNTNKKLEFELALRIPGWARNKPVPGNLYEFMEFETAPVTIKVNDVPVQFRIEQGYAIINTAWTGNDKIELQLPMAVHRVKALDSLADCRGKVALQRGPIVYCAEWVDNQDQVSNLILPDGAKMRAFHAQDKLGGVVTILGEAQAVRVSSDGSNISLAPQRFEAIPYYAWAHRGEGEMQVWLPRRISRVEIVSK